MVTSSLGESIAHNIANQMTRLDWSFEDLARESGLPWGLLVSWRGDAATMTMPELAEVAAALRVSPADLLVTA